MPCHYGPPCGLRPTTPRKLCPHDHPSGFPSWILHDSCLPSSPSSFKWTWPVRGTLQLGSAGLGALITKITTRQYMSPMEVLHRMWKVCVLIFAEILYVGAMIKGGPPMHWSYGLFRIFGIQVRMHVTFLFIVAYFAFVWGAMRQPGGVLGAAYGVVLVIMLFGLVTIHELTHSLVARKFGVEVKNITLLPIGGMASMSEIPRDPRQELAISVAGPLSNVVLALVMAVGAALFVNLGDLTDPDHLASLLMGTGFKSAYFYLMAVNVMLAVFNLLPAFPMDGGRVFRAFLTLRVGRPRATRLAVQVGQTLALLLGLLGVLGGGIIMLLVAMFIYFGAQAEGRQEEVQAVLGGLRVSQAVNTGVEVVQPQQTI